MSIKKRKRPFIVYLETDEQEVTSLSIVRWLKQVIDQEPPHTWMKHFKVVYVRPAETRRAQDSYNLAARSHGAAEHDARAMLTKMLDINTRTLASKDLEPLTELIHSHAQLTLKCYGK